MTTIRRLEPLSLARIVGVIYCAIGLIAGVIVSGLTLFAGLDMAAGQPEGAPLLGLLFGTAAVLLPLVYGAIGFLTRLVGSWILNLTARLVGGLEVELA